MTDELPAHRHDRYLRALEDAAVAAPDVYDDILSEVATWRARIWRARGSYLLSAGGIDWDELVGEGRPDSDHDLFSRLQDLSEGQRIAVGRMLELAARDRAWRQ